MRLGANPNESVLTPANVNAQTFGKVGQVKVDGQLYAQPLYKTGVPIPGRGTRDVVFVATGHDSVYALDAHSLAGLWKTSFINPARGVTTIPTSLFDEPGLGNEIGIVGTPVIDASSSTLYVVARTREVSGANVKYVQRLHALDLSTGREKFGGPVIIAATVPGFGAGSIKGSLSFDPLWEYQRSGLLLQDGTVYIAWASQGDKGPYHGWLIGYDARTLRQVFAYTNTPNGIAGGIWMSGGAPAADAAGNIYLASGNGTFTANKLGGRDYGDSLIKINPRARRIVDYFTPFNENALAHSDLDFGSGGVMLLPDQPGPRRHLMITGAKEGRIYLVDRDNLGKHSPSSDRVVQSFRGLMNAVFDTPAYFNTTIYYVGTGPRVPGGPRNVLLALSLANGRIVRTKGGDITYGYPGSTPSVSSSGATNGIVWTLDNGASIVGPAILRAYDAAAVSRELYDSTQAGDRDTGGTAVKFAVADGGQRPGCMSGGPASSRSTACGPPA